MKKKPWYIELGSVKVECDIFVFVLRGKGIEGPELRSDELSMQIRQRILQRKTVLRRNGMTPTFSR